MSHTLGSGRLHTRSLAPQLEMWHAFAKSNLERWHLQALHTDMGMSDFNWKPWTKRSDCGTVKIWELWGL